jgi:TPR repeat protein
MRIANFGLVAATILFTTVGCNAPAPAPTSESPLEEITGVAPPSITAPQPPTAPAPPPTLEEQLQGHMLAAANGDPKALLAAADIYCEASRQIDQVHHEEIQVTPINSREKNEPIVMPRVEYEAAKDREWRNLYRSRELVIQAALLGNVEAMVRAGDIYSNGMGYRYDLAGAAAWYTLASNGGDASAARKLGACYEKGRGVTSSIEEAIKQYQAAVEAGDIIAQVWKDRSRHRSDETATFSDEAITLLRATAEKGDAESQLELGRCYGAGVGMDKDPEQALLWYLKAAKQGLAEAQDTLGFGYLYGLYGETNYEQAFNWYYKAAEQGYAEAQHSLGVEYGFGKLVVKDIKKSLEWHNLAAEQGYPDAQYSLGMCYEYGEGVEKNLEKSLEWYRNAAERDNFSACAKLGDCYRYGIGMEKDDKLANEWYQKAVESDVTGGWMLYSRGQEHAPDGINVEDSEQAYYWHQKSAEMGNAGAQLAVSKHYANGDGVKKDPKRAAEWCRKAAEQGNVDAQNILAFFYKNGKGVKQDIQQAIEWYRKAAEQGNTFAQVELGLLYSNGDNIRKDVNQAILWYRRAAEQGYWNAQHNLANLYDRGDGVSQNYLEAYTWYNIAATDGAEAGEFSGQARDRIATRMTPEQIAEAQRRSAVFKPKTWAEIQAAESAAGSAELPPATGQKSIGSATAFVVTTDGYLVTAAHVIAKAQRVELHRDGKSVAAMVVATDTANDLAILKAEGVFTPVTVHSSTGVALGAEVCTVGFPNVGIQGITPKATRGNVNSLRGIQDDPRFFQISAQINPGNSGGALIDMTGSVVGVVVSMINEAASLAITGTLPQNVNYAVKSAYLSPLLESVPGLAASLKTTEFKPAVTPEVAIAALEAATYLVLTY